MNKVPALNYDRIVAAKGMGGLWSASGAAISACKSTSPIKP